MSRFEFTNYQIDNALANTCIDDPEDGVTR